MFKAYIAFFIYFLFVFPVNVFAHPVSYKDSIGVMTWNQPFLSDYWLTYSYTHYAAVAARAMRMEMPEGEYLVYMPQADFLLKRWNNPDSQANIYVYGGAGGAQFLDKKGHAEQVGIEADAESRTWFIMGKWETMWSNVADRFDHGEFRLGLAPYEAEFNEIASWFMVQYQYHPTLKEDYVITPLYRVFYKSFLVESGVSLRGDLMMNFMFHF